MLINDPIHKKNFINYVEKTPLNEDIINFIIKDCREDKNPGFYLEYASLFKKSFEFNNSEEKVNKLNIAGYFSYKYSLLLDSALDIKTKHTTLKLINIYLEESIKILTDLFGLDSIFWNFWSRRKHEVFEASKNGKKAFNYTKFSMQDYEMLCDSKSALGKIALDSLFILSDNLKKDNYEKLLKSHKYFSVGFQINDDIEDFIEDFENKDFNFAYYKYVIEGRKKVQDIKDLKKMFYINGIATDLYKLALSYFQKSLVIAKEVGENVWLQAIEGKIKETKSVINYIEEYLTIINTKVSFIENAIPINFFKVSFDKESTVGKGLGYLIKEWEKDYPEVKHIMVLSNLEGFENEKSVHVTDIFQRGIITNNLIDIGNNYKIDLSKIIIHEIDYLVQNRNREGVGCWSYFPSVKEIAPDADDLGQMMQVFIKNGENKIINDYCLTGIQILIKDCYNNKTGGLETWIIPKQNPSKIQRIQRKFNDTKWGAGPDIDVMANFLYALCLKDYKDYKDLIEKGTEYIYSKIENGCFWNSRWYYGWQYGTFICVRLSIELLKHNTNLNNTYSNVLNDIKNYILKTQKDDGGWANNSTDKPDPLNTSLALSTLFLFSKSYGNTEPFKKGIDYLKNTQNKDGSWDAIPFIKPKQNEPYKSKVITTSYVLNTLTAYNGTDIVR